MSHKIVRKRGHPEDEQLVHSGVKGMQWGKRVDYVRGSGWIGDGINKHLQDPAPFQGRTKQYSGSGKLGLIKSALASKKSQTSKSGSSTSSSKPSSSSASSSSSSSKSSGGGGGSSSGGSKFDAELRAKLDALRGNSEKSQKEKEKEEKKAEQERKKKEREEAAAQRKAEAERKREAAAKEKERKEREREENKAYKQRLAIERQARQLFDKWKQEEVQKKKKKDNTLKKSQISMVADRGRMKSWNGPRRSRSNMMT